MADIHLTPAPTVEVINTSLTEEVFDLFYKITTQNGNSYLMFKQDYDSLPNKQLVSFFTVYLPTLVGMQMAPLRKGATASSTMFKNVDLTGPNIEDKKIYLCPIAYPYREVIDHELCTNGSSFVEDHGVDKLFEVDTYLPNTGLLSPIQYGVGSRGCLIKKSSFGIRIPTDDNTDYLYLLPLLLPNASVCLMVFKDLDEFLAFYNSHADDIAFSEVKSLVWSEPLSCLICFNS